MACEHGIPFLFTCDRCPPPSKDGMIEIDIVREERAGFTVTCPCCHSTDTTGTKTARISTICWNCYALFKEAPGGAVQIDECMCGRHDNGKTVKSAEREEVIGL